jgi:hypothetical protein
MIKSKNKNSASILVLLITCSRTKQRQMIEKLAIEQLVKTANKEAPNISFMLFDNNSIYSEHLDKFKEIGLIFHSNKNRGLWSAIHWVLKNEFKIYENPHKYLHIIESDLYVKTLLPLIEISNTLDKFSNLHMARTQEFSVRTSWRFNKKYSRLPYPLHVRRSQVDLKNTSNFVDFEHKLIANLRKFKLYSSNLNAKLPGLHKIESLRTVIYKLAIFDSFSEKNFFEIYSKLSNQIALLDGGIWHSLTDSKKYSKDTGSYGNPSYLSKIGYQETRYSAISNYKATEIILDASSNFLGPL